MTRFLLRILQLVQPGETLTKWLNSAESAQESLCLHEIDTDASHRMTTKHISHFIRESYVYWRRRLSCVSLAVRTRIMNFELPLIDKVIHIARFSTFKCRLSTVSSDNLAPPCMRHSHLICFSDICIEWRDIFFKILMVIDVAMLSKSLTTLILGSSKINTVDDFTALTLLRPLKL